MWKNSGRLDVKNDCYVISIAGEKVAAFNISSFNDEVAEEVFNSILYAYMLGIEAGQSDD